MFNDTCPPAKSFGILTISAIHKKVFRAKVQLASDLLGFAGILVLKAGKG
jgi:hypothetical protein